MRIAIINDTSSTNHYGCLMVMRNIDLLLDDKGVDVAWTWPVGSDWRKRKSEIINKPQIDAIIVNGEGTIHHGPKRWQAEALAEFAEFAQRVLKVPVFLINATLYANEKSLYNSLRFYNAIYVRDRMSHEELNKFNIKNYFVPDMTFAKTSILKPDQTKKICVVDSVMQSDIPFLRSFGKKHQADYCSMVVARPSNYSFWKKPRRFFLTSFKWLIKERLRSLDPKEFERYLGHYQLVVTGRYHTVTMCLKNHIPFVALESNTPKISYLLTEVFGNTKRVLSAKDVDNINLEDWSKYSNDEIVAINSFLKKAEDSNVGMIKKLIDITKKVSE
jgi:polysaccharide pyruvyl transferase WcaK-like protein